MNFSKLFKCFVSLSFIVGMFAFQSKADVEQVHFYSIGGSTAIGFSVTVTPAYPYDANNPNQFPVAYINFSGARNYGVGFLLDGSEKSNMWMKLLDEARINNRQVDLIVDDNANNGYFYAVQTNTGNSVGKIWNLRVYSDR